MTPPASGSVLHYHWSSSNEPRLSLVESFKVLLRQVSYAIKNQLGHPKPPTRGFGTQNTPRGVFCLLLSGSLWHKDRWLPCTERSYYRHPYAIKNQRGATKAPSRGLWMRRAGSLWHKRAGVAIPRLDPRHRGGPVCLQLK